MDYSSLCPLEQVTAVGASVLVEGKIELVEGKNHQHVVELRVDKVLHIGAVDIDKYPLPNVELPPDECDGPVELKCLIKRNHHFLNTSGALS